MAQLNAADLMPGLFCITLLSIIYNTIELNLTYKIKFKLK